MVAARGIVLLALAIIGLQAGEPSSAWKLKHPGWVKPRQTPMLPQSTIRLAPLAARYGHIVRWIWLALPEDANQEAAITELEYPHLTELAREELVRFRLHRLRHEVWDRGITRLPHLPSGLRPSKLRTRRGYRRNKAAIRGNGDI